MDEVGRSILAVLEKHGRISNADLPAYEDFHANRLAALPGVAAVTSYVTMKSLATGTACSFRRLGCRIGRGPFDEM